MKTLYFCEHNMKPCLSANTNTDMTILFPKFFLPGINVEHLRLLDTKCKAEGDNTYYSLTTPLAGCKTTRRHTTTTVVYSNVVLKVPTASKKALARDLKIQFSCIYSSHGVVSSVGWKAFNREKDTITSKEWCDLLINLTNGSQPYYKDHR